MRVTNSPLRQLYIQPTRSLLSSQDLLCSDELRHIMYEYPWPMMLFCQHFPTTVILMFEVLCHPGINTIHSMASVPLYSFNHSKRPSARETSLPSYSDNQRRTPSGLAYPIVTSNNEATLLVNDLIGPPPQPYTSKLSLSP